MAQFATNHDLSDLIEHVFELQRDWVIYNKLFVPERTITTLNRRGGWVWRRFQVAMQDRILLSIARLFDDKKYMNHRTGNYFETLTLKKVIAAIPDSPKGVSPEDRREIVKRRYSICDDCKALAKEAEDVIEHRHRRIVHNDKEVKRNRAILPGVKREKVDELVKKIGSLTGRISEALGEGQVGFVGAELDIEPQCDILVAVVRIGNDRIVQREAERRRELGKLERGEPADMDKITKLYGDRPDEDDYNESPLPSQPDNGN